MTERLIGPETIVTPENLPELRVKIAKLREQKGKEDEALDAVRHVRKEAKKLEEHEHVVDLYWEEYLVGKGIVMEARDREGLWQLPLKVGGIAKGYLMMRRSANTAEEYIQEKNVENKKPRSGRFLGEIAMLEKRYGEAIERFRESVELFENMEEFSQRKNTLELKGFLAEALTLAGKPEKGASLALLTYYEYEDELGEEIKKNDYYEWAVWRTGCIIKQWHALLAKDLPIEDSLARHLFNLLQESKSLLEFPEDRETDYGDKSFAKRNTEVEAIERTLKERGFSVN